MISNKDVKFYITANFINDEPDFQTERNALIFIAQELQRFNQYEAEHTRNQGDGIIRDKININSRITKFKDKQLRKLKGNLKIACIVAKIIMAAKAKEINSLVNHVNIIKDEKTNLLKTLTQRMDLIEELQTHNAAVNNDIQHINIFIHLGYQELQKMRKQFLKDIPHLIELKEILLACGQYYADYCNERERCTQLERQNRFLKNKLSILENNLVATNEELHNLRNQNIRLTRTLDGKQVNVETVPKMKIDQINLSKVNRFALTTRSFNGNCPQVEVSKTRLNIMSHLSTLNSLLFAQDSMLQDLKKISEELCMSE